MYYKLFIIFFLLFFFNAEAQIDTSEKAEEGGIYMLQFKIEDDLMQKFILEFPDIKSNLKFFTSFSEIVQFSDEILDSIKFVSEWLFSKKFNTDIRCIYKYTKKGKKVTSVGLLGHPNSLNGMPVNTFKNTIENYKKKYYIKILASFQAGGYSIDFGGGKRSKIKPKLTLIVNVFDINKNSIFKNKVVEKNFEKLRSRAKSFESLLRGKAVITVSETLNAEDFFSMYK